MASTLELIRELHDRRNDLIKEQREVFTRIEASPDGEGVAAEREQWDRIDKDVVDLGNRIQSMQTMHEHEQDQAAQREKFAKLITPEQTVTEARGLEDKLRSFMRATVDPEHFGPRFVDVPINGLERFATLVKGVAGDGPELVPEGFIRRLYEHMVEMAGARQTNAQVLTTSSGESIRIPKTTTHGGAAQTAETVALSANDPQFAEVAIGAYKFGQLIQVSRELVEDEAVDLLGYIARAAGRNIGLASGVQYANGDGTTEPEGYALNPVAGKTGTTGQTLTVAGDDLIDLYHSIISGWRRQGVWVMNDLSAAIVRKIKDGTGGAGLGNYLWQPGLVAGAPDTILGRPVVTDPNLAVMAANAYSIAFGDFSEFFLIRDVSTIRFERSDDFAFSTDLVTFKATLRTDSKQIVNGANGAVKFYRNSAT